MAETEPSKLAILFADMVGSTRFYDRYGIERGHAVVNECLAGLRQVTQNFRGRVIKTIGDELMAVFAEPDMAWFAASEMQWKVADLAPIDDSRVSIRVGFHYGEAMERGGDVFGDSVNVAARIAELAKGDQIITSAQTLAAISRELAAGARHLWPIQVKGRAEPVDLFEIMWDANDDATITMSSQFMPPKVPVRLRVLHCGREVCVGAEHPLISIGRDAVNEVVVDERKASRVHARIEWRRDKFVLTDVSSNGTYVIADDAAETCLRREEYILDGSGTLSLGRSHHAGPRNFVEFYSEYYTPSGRSISRSLEAAAELAARSPLP